MAEQLISQLVTDFDPTAYRDEYQERVAEFLEARAEGERVRVPEPSEQPGGVVDLMAALEGSLRSVGANGGGGAGAAGDGAATGPGEDADRLRDVSKDELYERAQERDLSGRSDMTKEELVEALTDDAS